MPVKEKLSRLTERSKEFAADIKARAARFDLREAARSLGELRWLPRLLTALLIVLIPIMMRSHFKLTEMEFYLDINLPLLLICAAAIFIALCFVRNERFICALWLISGEIYCIASARNTGDYFLAFGLSVVMAIFVGYSYLKAPTLSKRSTWIAVGAMALPVTAFISLVCIMKYNDYRTSCFDFGIFVQMFHYMRETGLDLTTCERGRLLSHFAVHCSPIYYLLLPFYAIFPSAHTLNIAQAIVAASGVIPLVLLCRKRGLPEIAAVVLSGCWLIYPAFVGGELWYLHENAFLAPLILWMVYFGECENTVGTLISSLLTLAVKEDAAVYVAVVALYFILMKKNKKTNAGIFVLAIAYFVLATRLLSMYGDGVMNDRFSNYIYDDGGMATFFKAVIQNPAYAVKMIFAEEKLLFIFQMLMPLFFIPLMTKKPERLVLLIPLVLFNLMVDFSYQYDIEYQYAFGSGALLFCLAVLNLSEMRPGRGKLMVCAGLSSIIIFVAGWTGTIDYVLDYDEISGTRDAITEVLSCIPDDASVAASSFIMPNLAQREEIYELDTILYRTDYIAVDLRDAGGGYFIDKYESLGYTLIAYHEGCAAVLQK